MISAKNFGNESKSMIQNCLLNDPRGLSGLVRMGPAALAAAIAHRRRLKSPLLFRHASQRMPEDQLT
jgi:hypothetical protein